MIDKSWVPVGTGDTVQAAIAEELAQGGLTMDFALVLIPEFLKEGAALSARRSARPTLRPPKPPCARSQRCLMDATCTSRR